RNSRSGACRLRAQAVRPLNVDRAGELILASFSRATGGLGPMGSLERMASPVSRVLSSSQLATLTEHGEERTAAVGEKLFEIGDRSSPFIAIVEGGAAVLDGAGHEIVRHGASGFLGEMNLLSGQTVFLTAVVTEPMRYIAVDREILRQL